MDATQKEVQKDIDQHTVQTAEAEMRQDDTPSNQEIDELLKDMVEEPLNQVAPPQEYLHLQQPQTSPTKMTNDGLRVADQTTSAPQQ